MALKDTLLAAGKEGLSEYDPVISKPTNTKQTKNQEIEPKKSIETEKITPERKDAATKKTSQTKREPGRPPKDPTVKKTVYISEENIANLKAPLLINNGNLSAYINKLIEQDVSANKALYDQMLSLTQMK